MIRLLFVGLFSFVAGIAVNDTAVDYFERPVCMQALDIAEQAVEQTERFGAVLAHVLNGGAIQTKDVIASCRVKPIKES